jgi:hypothetical protein
MPGNILQGLFESGCVPEAGLLARSADAAHCPGQRCGWANTCYNKKSVCLLDTEKDRKRLTSVFSLGRRKIFLSPAMQNQKQRERFWTLGQ